MPAALSISPRQQFVDPVDQAISDENGAIGVVILNQTVRHHSLWDEPSIELAESLGHSAVQFKLLFFDVANALYSNVCRLILFRFNEIVWPRPK